MAKPKAPTKKLRKEWFKAYEKDDVAAITAHLDAGVDPNAIFSIDWEHPALGAALDRVRAPKIARLLLDRGADVKVAGPKGTTALHLVHDGAFAKELIERGADINARDQYQRTPLHSAVAAHSKQHLLPVVEALVAAGVDMTAVDNNGNTAYQLAHDAAFRAFLREKGSPVIGPGGGKALTPTTIDGAVPADVGGDRGAIGVGRDGDVWMWSYRGFFRLRGDALQKLVFEESFAISDVAAGPSGTMYFGTNWGLLRYRGDEWRLFTTQNSELFDHHLTFTTIGPDDRVYMISYEHEAEDKHVSVFDGETFSVLEGLPPGIELQRVSFDRNGELMLCGRGGFAFKRDGEWVVLRKMEEKGWNATVYDAVDDGEAIWVGTQSGVYERRGDTVTKHETKNLAKYLLKDGDTLWVGTYFGGIARLRGGEVTIFDQKNSPLPHDDVNGLVRAPDGKIWVLTRTARSSGTHEAARARSRTQSRADSRSARAVFDARHRARNCLGHGRARGALRARVSRRAVAADGSRRSRAREHRGAPRRSRAAEFARTDSLRCHG